MGKIDNIRKYAVIAFVAVGFLALGMESFKTLPKYTGKGDGFYEDVVVEITAERNRKGQVRVKEITVTHEETEYIGGIAMDDLKKQVLEKQDPAKIDIVAGATYSSEGFIDAVKDAFKQVK